MGTAGGINRVYRVEFDWHIADTGVITQQSGHGRHPIVHFNGGKLALQSRNDVEYPGCTLDNTDVMALRIYLQEDSRRADSLQQLRKNCIQPLELNWRLAPARGIDRISPPRVLAQSQQRIEVSPAMRVDERFLILIAQSVWFTGPKRVVAHCLV